MSGLIIDRRISEQIYVKTSAGETMVITVLRSGHGRVKLAFEAPQSITILRPELLGNEVQSESSAKDAT